MSNDFAKSIQQIPKERVHGLVCKRSGIVLFGGEIEPCLVIEATPVDSEESHLFVIDMRDAKIIKKSLDAAISS